MLFYSSTFVLYVKEIIVVIASISKCILWLFIKHCDKIVWSFLVNGLFSRKKLRNCKNLGLITWHMEMD
jgi:hypothetical protein